MKLAIVLLLAILGLASNAEAYTSTINPLQPVQNAPLSSAPVRNNFQSAYNDINNIYSLLPGTIGSVTGVTCNTANGVSCTTSGTATQALTFSLGAITPSSVTATGNGSFGGTLSVAGNATLSGTTTTNITGSTQCVHVNSSGVLAGTGSDCVTGVSPGGSTYAIQYNVGNGTLGGISVANGQILIGQTGTYATPETVSGDLTLAATGAAILATVNSGTGTFGTATVIPQITVNGKGLITAATTNTIPTATSSVLGLVKPDNSTITISGGVLTAAPSNLTAGESVITGGTNSYILYNNNGVLGNEQTVPVANGGTGAATLTGYVYGNGTSAMTASTTLPESALTALSANQVLGSLTAVAPSGLSVPSCSTSASALQWTSGTGFGCNTAIAAPAGTLSGTTINSTVTASSLTSFGASPVLGTPASVTLTNGTGLPLTTGVTGILPLANGGTGASVAMQENGVFVNGDSRASNVYTDTQGLVQNPYSPLNFANSLLGEPLNIIGDAALSGTRTDQLFTGGAVLTGTISAGGSSYTSGTYYNVNMTGGSGSGFRANIVVSGGAVTSVTPITNANYTAYNTGSYLVGDVLSASASNIGGTGSGFTYTVATIQTQMAAALASNARNLWLQDGVNDIGQSYPSASTSGATACSNIKTYVSQAVAAGKRVFLMEEYGSTSDSSTQLGQLVILRQCEEEYARSNVGNLILIDLAPIIYSPTNTSTTALTFNANYSTDGTHLNNYGAYYAGSYIKNILQTILPNVPAPSGAVAAYQDVSTGGPQLASNPIFVNTATISGVTGITGTGPTNWTWVVASGSPTATVTMQSNTDTIGGAAIGKEAVVNLTCDAAGSKIRVYNGPSTSSWSLTGKYYSTGGYYVEPGSSNFGGVALELDIATNVTTNPAIAMYAYGNVAGTANGYSGRLLTPINFSPIGSATQSYLSEQYELYCTGSGSAVVHLRPTGIWTVI